MPPSEAFDRTNDGCSQNRCIFCSIKKNDLDQKSRRSLRRFTRCKK